MPPQSRGSHGQTASTIGKKQQRDQNTYAGASLQDETAQAESTSEDEDSEQNSSDDEQEPNSNSIKKSDSISHATSIAHPTPRKTPVQRSHSYGPAVFAPPFYNRPPTPLPPSPSLTSLLRPLRGGTPLSRTTTPESSDTDNTPRLPTNPTEAAVAQSARVATAVQRASPKVPTYEYYGFLVYIGSSAAFLVYLLWSYLPAALLHRLGMYYYPNRWWSLAIPAWLVVLVLYVYIALAAWNTGVLTLPVRSLECLVDEKARIAVIDREGNVVRAHRSSKEDPSFGHGYGRAGLGGTLDDQDDGDEEIDSLPELAWGKVWNEGTDAVMDIPIGGVCEILYGSSQDYDDDDVVQGN